MKTSKTRRSVVVHGRVKPEVLADIARCLSKEEGIFIRSINHLIVLSLESFRDALLLRTKIKPTEDPIEAFSILKSFDLDLTGNKENKKSLAYLMDHLEASLHAKTDDPTEAPERDDDFDSLWTLDEDLDENKEKGEENP